LKKLIIITALLVALCAGASYGQGVDVTVMPIVKTGAIFTAGDATEFGFAAGANVNLYRDTETGFATYTYVGKFFSGKGEDNIEYTTFFACVEKSFPEFKGNFKPYLAIGYGQVNEGNAAYMLDFGGVIYQKVGLSLSGWYAPESDEVFVSANINLTP
jgi:hypothetical protein